MDQSDRAQITISLDQPTGNVWIDNGLVVLARGLGEGEHASEDVLYWLLERLVQKTGNKGEYYDEATGQIREYEKVSWVYPTDRFIKVKGQTDKVKVADQHYYSYPPRYELRLKLSKRSQACDMCGDEAPTTNCKMWMYPFIVDPGKFGNFYSGGKRGLRMCARCALAGLAGYLGWLWKAQGGEALHFFVFHSQLRELERLHREVFEPLRLQGSRGGNVDVAFAGPYLHETTLGLFLRLFNHIHSSDQEATPLAARAREHLASLIGDVEQAPASPVTLYAVTGEPGQSFTMHAIWEFSKFQWLYQLYQRWIALFRDRGVGDPRQRVDQVLRQFQARQGGRLETLWRDYVARAVLSFADPLPVIVDFLFDARAKEEVPKPLVWGTLDVLDHYAQEVLGMDDQFQRTLAGFGHALGNAAGDHEEMGLLYALRNSKNPEAFYRMLNDAQFRLDLTVPEGLLDMDTNRRIQGIAWTRVKTMLAIYAMNAFLRRRSSPTGGSSHPSNVAAKEA
ncbi:MAG: hypothetical protein ABEL51_02635 [Salinibacter sp.]